MKKKTKPVLSPKGKIKNKKEILIATFITFIIVLFCTTISNNQKSTSLKSDITKTKYFTGDIYSANHAANLVDFLKKDSNILISPFNVNTSLAILYNGTDNNSNKEMKNYFKKNINTINEELSLKINLITEEENIQTKFHKIYEEYIKELYDNSYDLLTISKINYLKNDEKEKILLLLKKIDLTFNRLNGNNTITEKVIKKYKLTKDDITYNSYKIKSELDKILDNYETYCINNNVINYTEIFSSNLNSKKLSSDFKKNTDYLNYNLKKIDFSKQEETVKEINDTIKSSTYEKISRGATIEDIKENNTIIFNSLYFNYEWEENFRKENVISNEFYNYQDEVEIVDMMYSVENNYFENEYAKAFSKDFENSKYSFIGILPKSSNELNLSSLNLNSLLSSKKEEKVMIALPKFDFQYEADLINLLSNYKIKEVFTSKSNFTKMSEDNIYISKMSQKNHLTIAEKGTAESTINSTSTIETYSTDLYNKEIILNRPFAFLIINNESNDVILAGRILTINQNN